MTTSDTTARTSKTRSRFRLPDLPEREPDDMTSAEHLSETGLHHHLKQFLGNPEPPSCPVRSTSPHGGAPNVAWLWEDGRLGCHDPATGLHIATFESERARADAERDARVAAEARVRELEGRLGDTERQ